MRRRFTAFPATPTDGDVLDAVATAKRALRTAETRAQNLRQSVRDNAFGSYSALDDVEKAARHNVIRRAEVEIERNLENARKRYTQRIAFIRQHAGQWVDLVPEVVIR